MFKGHGGNITQSGNNGILDFSASINPLGYPAGVRQVIYENLDSILHYPDIDCTGLRRYISRHIGHSEDEIIAGNGSTELFYLIPRTVRPVKGVVFQPTFSEFAEALRCSHAEVAHMILKEEDYFSFKYDKDYFHDKAIEMVFLCNPNNPTGRLVDGSLLLNMARQYPHITFVIDEAFVDFIEEPERYSVIHEAGILPNLVVVRSLTKFYGFPGIRIGYLVAHRDFVKRMMEYKEPWSVNTLAQCAAMAALEDKEFVSKSKEFMIQERLFLWNELSGIQGILPYKPTANYILVKIGIHGMTSATLRQKLLECGIAIRDCSNFIGLHDKYFRVAVRTREENIRLITMLKNVVTHSPETQSCRV